MGVPQGQKMMVNDAEITSRSRCIDKPGSYMVFPRANRVEHQLPKLQGAQAQVLTAPQQGGKICGTRAAG